MGVVTVERVVQVYDVGKRDLENGEEIVDHGLVRRILHLRTRIGELNLDAVFLGTREAIRAMKSGSGSIINISSIEGIIGEPVVPAYNASKGGVRTFTKSAASKPVGS